MTESEKLENAIAILEAMKKQFLGETRNVIDVAIKALEKQIPKKPRFYAHNYYCSVCDNLVGNNEFEWKRFKYCDTCGQKLDWSDEE